MKPRIRNCRTKKTIDVYVTRSSYSSYVHVFPAKGGIRKFEGCVEWGAAWNKKTATARLTRTGHKSAEYLSSSACHERFGFYPASATAYLVEGKKRTKVDIDFTN